MFKIYRIKGSRVDTSYTYTSSLDITFEPDKLKAATELRSITNLIYTCINNTRTRIRAIPRCSPPHNYFQTGARFAARKASHFLNARYSL